MTNNSEFHALLLINQNVKSVAIAVAIAFKVKTIGVQYI